MWDFALKNQPPRGAKISTLSTAGERNGIHGSSQGSSSMFFREKYVAVDFSSMLALQIPV